MMFCFLYDCIEKAIHSLLQAGDSSAGLRRRILEAKDAEEQLHVDCNFGCRMGTQKSISFLFGTREIYTECWLDQRGTVFCRYFLEHLESARDALDGFD